MQKLWSDDNPSCTVPHLKITHIYSYISYSYVPNVIIRCDETDADARTMLLITIGEEIRYLQMCEVDPKTPNTEKTLELRI